MPEVSVVIPFLNAEPFLSEALDSVIAQSLQDWEVILVDDGSTDGSREVAMRYAERDPARIRIVEHPGRINCGAAASRNLAVSHARAELVALLDADDRWERKKLEQQVDRLGSNPQAGMVCGPSIYWRSWDSASTETDWIPPTGLATDRLYPPMDLTVRSYPLGQAFAPCPSSILLRRSVILGIGGFEPVFHREYQLYEDQAFLSKVYLRHSVYVMSEALTIYRIHELSCDSQVVGAGKYDQVRSFFMAWYEDYLRQQGVRDRRIWEAFRAAAGLPLPGFLERWLPGRISSFVGDEGAVVARFEARRILAAQQRADRDRLLNRVLIAADRGDRVAFTRQLTRLALSDARSAFSVIKGVPQSNRLRFTIAPTIAGGSAVRNLEREGLRLLRLHPEGTAAGLSFNVQKDGSSALAVECEGADRNTVIVFGETTLETSFASPQLLTGRVPESLFGLPGSIPVFLRSGG
jgi:glycosyltransferase involved in cell wall biosynthesis